MVFVVQAGDVAPLLQLPVDVRRGPGVGEPGLSCLLRRRVGEHPGLGGLQLLHFAAVVGKDRAGRLHVAAACQLQLEVDAVGLSLLLQRGNLRTKAVCRLSVFGGFGDLRLELRDPGIPLSQLRLVRCRVSAASCCPVICRASRLRFLLARLLLRRLLPLLLRVLLRLRAILLTVHVVAFPLGQTACAGCSH